MSTIEQSIDVHVPVRTAYNQWTQFETFPDFMDGVESVTQLDDTHLHWIAEIAGVRREWDAEITEQSPDERVAWRATDGTENAGVVTFHHVSADTTRIMLQLEFDPEGFVRTRATRLGSFAIAQRATSNGTSRISRRAAPKPADGAARWNDPDGETYFARCQSTTSNPAKKTGMLIVIASMNSRKWRSVFGISARMCSP
jgi:hypothetical protein